MENSIISQYIDQEIQGQLQDIVSEKPAQLFLTNNSDSNFSSVILFNKFGVPESNTLTMNSDITTHYTEDNVAIQDHWALPPETYTLSGLIGELIYYKPSGFAQTFSDMVDNLQPLASLIPTFGNYTQAAVNVAFQIEDSVNRYTKIANSAFSALKGTNTQFLSNQEQVVIQLRAARNNRQLVTLKTPYGVMSNMAIVSIVVSQKESLYQSNVEISLQKWRFVGTSTREATEEEKSLLSGIKSIQSAEEADRGLAQGENQSFLRAIAGGRTAPDWIYRIKAPFFGG